MQPKDVQPPWIDFPKRAPGEVFWKQGNAEPFMLNFVRFWSDLPDEWKVEYLQYWRAPEG
jgi:hypothetical protein